MGTKDRAAALYSVGSGDPQTHDAVLRIGSELRGGGPILNHGIEATANTGPRHLEPSSATRRKRCGQARNCQRYGLVRLLSVRRFQYAGRRTTPSGTTPWRTRCQSAMSSLRAKAMIIFFRKTGALPVRA